MRDHIVLYVNGRRHELRGEAAFRPLSDYLRIDLGLTGTKVVCSEGDCGSCTVLIGSVRNGSIEYRSVCSCIQFAFQSDGCHVVTVEGLGGSEGNLDPVQEALVQHHGTQCGLCTPGIVMSIHALLESDPVLTERRLREGLVGNLCRCTGYDPIVRAGLQVDSARTLRMNELFNAPSLSSDLALCGDEPVHLESGNKIFFKPLALADAVTFKASHPECVLVSGGTDFGVQVNKGIREIKTVLSTTGLEDLRGLYAGEDGIVAGANVSIRELEISAGANLPAYAELISRFGSPQIRNAATLGGNIANGSPIGDTLPALFVLNAKVELSGTNGTRWVNINDFYSGYKKTVASADELICRILIPRPANGEVLKLYKVSKRKDLDISTFSAAIWMKLDGQCIQDVRIAYGGVAPTVMRLPGTEAYLVGKQVAASVFESAGEIAHSEVSPINDVRGSTEYRNKLSANILQKLYYDLVAEFVGTI
jgi:xanthine dehydrogenase small subunit